VNPPEMSVSAFAASLPAEYRDRFNPAQIAIHAHASVGRGTNQVNASLFPWPDPNLKALVVIAQDRPGLLSLISSALAEMGCDVDAAEAYTRSNAPEAVDVFWLRDPADRFTRPRVAEFVGLLSEILAGRPERSIPPPAPSERPSEGTTVRFLEDKDGALSILEVETGDRSGLLWAITRALYRQDVQIVGSKIRTEGGRVHDRFIIVELDGTPIKNERRFAIQVAILTAIGN
jgi:[protein-PII] uridylyltransferase